MLKITHVHMTTTTDNTHERIAQVWVVDTTNNAGVSWTVDQAVSHLNNGGKLYVVEPPRQIEVMVRSLNGRSFIQTVSDGAWSNNLLALPRY